MKIIYVVNNRKAFRQLHPFYNRKLIKVCENSHYTVYFERTENREIFVIYNNKSKRYLGKILQNTLVDILEERNVKIIEYN